VEAIHEFFANEKENAVVPQYLKKYSWFKPYFASFKTRIKQRPF